MVRIIEKKFPIIGTAEKAFNVPSTIALPPLSILFPIIPAILSPLSKTKDAPCSINAVNIKLVNSFNISILFNIKSLINTFVSGSSILSLITLVNCLVDKTESFKSD